MIFLKALSEAQKAASKFERANSQLAAAKEMVYLAEDGLKTEGRCFDHAFQEMLNHATSRVNESEHERAVCEAEHRRTTAFYHKAEFEVQRLQRDLKRSIAKSRRVPQNWLKVENMKYNCEKTEIRPLSANIIFITEKLIVFFKF